jgi:TorA maturation chaperone TorD
MNHKEIALARSRAYNLFSRLLLEGLSQDVFPIVKQLPEFTDLEEQDSAEWAAIYYQIFSMNVFPYETIFRGEAGLLGGPVTENVAHFYDSIGFPQPDDGNADHMGIELSALAYLCGAESDAHDDDMLHEAHRMIHFQRRFLDEHLLCWLPVLVKAIINQGNTFYKQLSVLLLKLTLEHRQSLGDDLMNPSVPFTLPERTNLLGQEKTGLRDIADYLLTTAYTGFYLSQEDIKKIGNRFRIPRGFGKRSQVLTNLLRTAVDYDSLDGILEALHEFAADWRRFYGAIEFGASVKPMIALWDEHLAQTQTLLEQIRTAVAEQKLVFKDIAEE